MKTGLDIAWEMPLRGQNIKKATKRRMSEGLKELVTQQGNGRLQCPLWTESKKEKSQACVKEIKRV